MISEGSWHTENRGNDAKCSTLLSQDEITFYKHFKIRNNLQYCFLSNKCSGGAKLNLLNTFKYAKYIQKQWKCMQ